MTSWQKIIFQIKVLMSSRKARPPMKWVAITRLLMNATTTWKVLINNILAKVGLKNCGGMGAAAETWIKYGVKLTKPALGCIAVVDGGQHVAFVYNYDPKKGIVTLFGGNQGKNKLTSTVNGNYPINKDRLTFIAPSGYEDKLHFWD